ncbi:protein of unknown function [Micropruina glycogenica]|uniref:Uncharacterized protein n=1 Tax=Micropruina glycogenica TaxID=75385 RepID=A0A2N9JMT6_9ACTN|nr:protein of unknown function [Micropruina glycogenica]
MASTSIPATAPSETPSRLVCWSLPVELGEVLIGSTPAHQGRQHRHVGAHRAMVHRRSAGRRPSPMTAGRTVRLRGSRGVGVH